jgi:transcriptional regulator
MVIRAALYRFDRPAWSSQPGPIFDILSFHSGSCTLPVEAQGIEMSEPKFDLPQGTLDLLILKVVTLGPVHGYAISQRLQQISRDVVQAPQGSLYPALHRLENRGLLAAEWKETDTRREAKFYRLTRKGRAYLEAQTAGWERLAEAVGLILAMPEGSAS